MRGAPGYLVHTDVALVTEHHVVAFFTVRGATHVADDIFVVLDPQTLHRLDGVVYVVVAVPLQSLDGAFHCQLIYRLLPLKRKKPWSDTSPKHKTLPGLATLQSNNRHDLVELPILSSSLLSMFSQ